MAKKVFERTKESELKLVTNALFRNVIKDAEIQITSNKHGGKYKAVCTNTNTYVQFPRDLRSPGTVYTADVIENSQEGKATFYSVVKGSIRKRGTDIVVG